MGHICLFYPLTLEGAVHLCSSRYYRHQGEWTSLSVAIETVMGGSMFSLGQVFFFFVHPR